MIFNDVLLVLSMASSGVIGVLENGNVAVSENLSLKEEQEIITQLVTAHNSGYHRCIVTRDGTYINSGHALKGYD